MGTKEKVIAYLAIKLIKKSGMLKALKKIVEKTHNDADNKLINGIILAVDLADRVICQGKPLKDLRQRDRKLDN